MNNTKTWREEFENTAEVKAIRIEGGHKIVANIKSFIEKVESAAFKRGLERAVEYVGKRIWSFSEIELSDTENGSDPAKGYVADATMEEFKTLLEEARSLPDVGADKV